MGGGDCVSVEGDHAFVGNYPYFAALDVAAPASPVIDTLLYAGGRVQAIEVDGDYAFVSAVGQGLKVADISDPEEPEFVESQWVSTYMNDLALFGDRIFGCGEDQFLCFDISDPLDIPSPDQLQVGDELYEMDIQGDYAFVADYNRGMVVIDISDPAAPVVAFDDTMGFAGSSIAVSGDVAYVGSSGTTKSISAVDVSDPTSPTLIETRVCDWGPRGVTGSGTHLFVADASSGPALRAIQVLQREVMAGDSLAQSSYFVDVGFTDPYPRRFRLSTTQTDSIRWEISTSTQSWTWFDIEPGGGWVEAEYAYGSIRWRATLVPSGASVPVCSDLHLEWLHTVPIIDGVTDVPDDQGRAVTVSWRACADDFPDGRLDVHGYSVYRRIDTARHGGEAGTSGGVPARDLSDAGGAGSREGTRYPPGDWHHVTTVEATGAEHYSVEVPTLVDSTVVGGQAYSVFFIRAVTDSLTWHFDSPPDSGWSVDNLPPAVPRNVFVDYYETYNSLVWDDPPDDDFQYFRVYRGEDPGFVPSPGTLVHSTIGTAWDDEGTGGTQYYYKVTALDFSGNESEATPAMVMVDVPEQPSPVSFRLYQNAPNPVTSATEIVFDVPDGAGPVSLRIYDVAGRLVRALADGPRQAGRNRLVWEGDDARGHPVASGVYYCRLEAPGFAGSSKITVVR